MPNAFVNSRFPRVPNDFYPTIDPRCVYGFLEHFQPRGMVVDPCAPQGSGIVDTLQECGYSAMGYPDAFDNFAAEWVVSNPPYLRGLVDKIIQRQIERIQHGVLSGVAMLLRSNFAFAKVHAPLFESGFYAGEIKLRFRPWWSDDRSKQPIHNFVWHIWNYGHMTDRCFPEIMFADGIPPFTKIVLDAPASQFMGGDGFLIGGEFIPASKILKVDGNTLWVARNG